MVLQSLKDAYTEAHPLRGRGSAFTVRIRSGPRKTPDHLQRLRRRVAAALGAPMWNAHYSTEYCSTATGNRDQVLGLIIRRRPRTLHGNAQVAGRGREGDERSGRRGTAHSSYCELPLDDTSFIR